MASRRSAMHAEGGEVQTRGKLVSFGLAKYVPFLTVSSARALTVNRRTTLRVVNLPDEIDSESRATVRHRFGTQTAATLP